MEKKKQDRLSHTLVFQVAPEFWCLDGMFLGSSHTSKNKVFGSLRIVNQKKQWTLFYALNKLPNQMALKK